MGLVNWKEWFLKWRHFAYPAENLYFKSIRVDGCGNKENRLLYFDSVNFNRESWQPLDLEPLPDMVPFLTTMEAMIPIPEDSVIVSNQLDSRIFIARFVQNEKNITYTYSPESGTLGDFYIESESGQPFTEKVQASIFSLQARCILFPGRRITMGFYWFFPVSFIRWGCRMRIY